MAELDTFETWTDRERRRAQWERLAARLPELRRTNPFYRARLSERASSLGDLPFTTKTELSEDQAARPPFGTNLTYPLERYVRLHQTSGTTGRPLRVLDTAESWEWWRECWQPIYRAAGVTARDRIGKDLGVEAFDHTGATEVGAHGFSCSARDGVHINESEFIAEVVDTTTGEAREEGDGELVLTNLGRWGMPVIRYRTGDRVTAVRGTCSCGRTLVKLAGGIAGRVDDMVTVRGVNVFPSAIEAILRRFAEVGEYRIALARVREMDELRCTVEAPADVAERVAGAIHRELGIRCVVEAVAHGTLPRFEMKAKRFNKTNV